MTSELKHFGVKGMKWGKRKSLDTINSKERSIKKGTTIQNISSQKLDMTKGRHMYGAYTKYDKEAYIDMMGNFMYNGKGVKNEFVVKKDIKVPSDKQLVENFVAIAKKNPKQVSKDMAAAHNDTHIFFEKKAKHFEKKLSKVADADTKRGEKLTKQYVALMVSDKAAKSRADFMGSLIKKGFDGMSDINDRDSNEGTQDPLIIFNPKKSLGKGKHTPLTKDELDKYYKKFIISEETKKERYDLNEVQHNQEVKFMHKELDDVLQHYGVKGMKWGKTLKSSGSRAAKKVKDTTTKAKDTVKSHTNSLKRERSWSKELSNAKNMSTKDIQNKANRAQLENDLKRLSRKSNVGSSKDKKDYLKRADMSDQEIRRKVQRLRAKDSLDRNASEASKTQKAIAKKVIKIAAPIVIQYALTGTIGSKDLIGIAMNPNVANAKTMKMVKDVITGNRTKHSEVMTDVILHSSLKEKNVNSGKLILETVLKEKAKMGLAY